MASTIDRLLLSEGDPPSKREVLRCALRLFVRRGLCETSIRDIAEDAGYTNPALYKFFDGKDALALHLFERCYEHLFAALQETQQKDGSFAENLDALLAGYARLLDSSLDAVLYVNETLRVFWPRLPASTRRRSLLRLFRALVELGRREGTVSPRVDADLAVAMLVGTLAQVARAAYFGEIPRPIAARAAGLRRLFADALTGGTRR